MARSKRFRDDKSSLPSLDEDVDLNTDKVETFEAENPEPEQGATQVSVETHEGEEEDPVEVLKRQIDEINAEKEAYERRARETEQLAREQSHQLEQHQVVGIAQQKAVLEHAYNTEELKLGQAKRKYAEALSNHDFDAAAEAQLEMSRSDGIMRQYADNYQRLEQQERQPRQQRQVQPSQDELFEQALSTMEPRVAAWAREHKADVLNPERQQLALAADALARAKGMKPGEDDYLDFIDEAMGYLEADEPRPAPKQQPKTRRVVSAPPSRTSSNQTRRREVVLNEDDKLQAEMYGVSHEEYARWKLDAEKNGQLNGGQREVLRFKAVSR